MTASRGSPTRRFVVDVCVVGGGPSGAATALRLAQLGHKVALIDGPQLHRRQRVECLPSSIGVILEALDLRDAIRAADGIPCSVLRRRWFNEDESIGYDGAVLMERDLLDRTLLRAAAAGGVAILSPARARSATWTPHGWLVRIDQEGGFATLRAAFLVDARGRTRRGKPRLEAALPLTAALSSQWLEHNTSAVAEMMIEAMADGWLWAVRLPTRQVHALAFVDLNSCRGLDSAGRRSRFGRLLYQSSFLRQAAPSWIETVDICDASFYLDDDLATSRMIKVGDAAMAIDPISSHGIQTALRSAIQGGAVVHTILSGGDTNAAISFYQRSLRACFAEHALTTAEVYAALIAKYRTSFWKARGNVESKSHGHRPVSIRHNLTEATRFSLSPQTQFISIPTIENNIVRQMEGIAHPLLPAPIVFLGGLYLASIVRLIQNQHSASAVRAVWAPWMSPERAMLILDWMLRNGIVVVDPSASPFDRTLTLGNLITSSNAPPAITCR